MPQNLKINFYESGQGETIIIEFPKGGLGVVDAHPSTSSSRPTIIDIVNGRKIHFVCLTHPHADHAKDLLQALKSASDVSEFWLTVPELKVALYESSNITLFPSRFRPAIEELRKEWANTFIDLFDYVTRKCRDNPNFIKPLSSEIQPVVIEDVEIYCLSPDRGTKNEYVNAVTKWLNRETKEKFNANRLSAVLVLKYGEHSVILGADALNKNWVGVIKLYGKNSIPKAVLLKVPHHGAKNSFDMRSKRNYLRLCSKEPKVSTVLFAGDRPHPNIDVFYRLKERTNLYCLNNGRKSIREENPLKLEIEGVAVAGKVEVCNPWLSFSIPKTGEIRLTQGRQCSFCQC